MKGIDVYDKIYTDKFCRKDNVFMKKVKILLLIVILSFIFTSCGMGKVSMVRDMGQIDTEIYSFDISAYPELIEAVTDENVYVTVRDIPGETQQLGVSVSTIGFSFYAIDFENEKLTPFELKSFGDKNVLTAFAHNGKDYYITMDKYITTAKVEWDGGYFELYNDGVPIAASYNCENGYVIMAAPTDTPNVMRLRVYSVEENDIVTDEEIEYTYRCKFNTSWIDGDRYMHFDSFTGQIVDVTDQFHAVDDNNIGGNTPTDKMAEYNYLWKNTFFTTTKEEGAVVYTMNNRVPFVTHIDIENYCFYRQPYLSEDGKTLEIAKYILKEKDR